MSEKRVVCGKKWPKWSGQNQLCGVIQKKQNTSENTKNGQDVPPG